MINIINEAINRKLNSISFTTVIKGTVESLQPLKIRINNKIVIGLSFIEPRSLGIDDSSPSSALPLVIGEEIEMIRYNNGQRFYVLGKAGGGSGGTTNYEQLNNLPKINNVTLVGNKSLNELGIHNYDDTEIRGLISSEANTRQVADNNLQTQIGQKQDILYSSGANQNIKTINNESILGAGNIDIQANPEIAIEEEEPDNGEVLWINPEEEFINASSEVIDSMEGSQHNLAPSVSAIKSYLSKSYVSIGLTDNTSVTPAAAYTDYKITLNKMLLSIGDSFEYTNGEIKIKKSGYYQVSANSMISSSSNHTRVATVKRNTERIISSYTSGITGYMGLSLSPRVIYLEENDIITLNYQVGTIGGTFRVAGSPYTYLTICEL